MMSARCKTVLRGEDRPSGSGSVPTLGARGGCSSPLSSNDKVERRAPSTFAPTPGSTLCPICKENPRPADRSTCHECEQELNANQECED